MHRSLSHLGDRELLRDLAAAVAHERITTAEVLLLIAEVDARRLYLPAAYPCMRDYCVGELGQTPSAAYKRIQAARLAREYPALFDAVADGRLNLTAILLLDPHLTCENASGLIADASSKSKSEIEAMLAERFPRTEFLPLVTEPAPQGASSEVVEGVPALAPERVGTFGNPLSPERVEDHSAKVTPLALQRFGFQCTLPQATHDKLIRIRALLRHAVPSGDLVQVLDRSFDALLEKLEKRKKAATSKPRAPRGSNDPRTIPAHVRRAVFERDGDQCTFVSEDGRRCEAREFLELDHIEPVARGGPSTLANLRLRCRAHNQMAADQVFGAEFMRRKREPRRPRTSKDRTEVAGRGRTRAPQVTDENVGDRSVEKGAEDLVPWLRALGYRPETARDAAARTGTIPGESLENRVKRALSLLRPRVRYTSAPAPSIAS